MRIELHDTQLNQKFRDLNLDKRDQIIEYGLFLDTNGLQNLQELFQEGLLEDYNNSTNQRLTQENQQLQDKLKALEKDVEVLKSEKFLIKEETQRETRQHLESTYENRLRNKEDVITELEGSLNRLKSSRQEDINRIKQEQVRPLQQELQELREERKSLQKEMKIEASQLLAEKEASHQETLLLKESLFNTQLDALQSKLEEANRWNLNSTTTSGNVAKGNIAEKTLQKILSENLGNVLGTSCVVEDVSKGSGGNADLLITIPERKLNILIESKNKLSEKVRTAEIERAKKDLHNNVHEANILVLVSFNTPCVKHEHLHTNYRTTEDHLKVFSVYTHFATHFEQDGGLGLCNWINFLSKSYLEVSPLVGSCDKSHLSNILTDLEQIIQSTCDQEKRLRGVIESLNQQLSDVSRLRIDQLPNLQNQIRIAIGNNNNKT